jgi:hypothetical protein
VVPPALFLRCNGPEASVVVAYGVNGWLRRGGVALTMSCCGPVLRRFGEHYIGTTSTIT